MKTFYVATLARYVLGCLPFGRADETEAASLGQDALHALYADLRAKHGRDIPIEIRTVRLADEAEIDLWIFHQRMIRENEPSQLKPGDRVRLKRMTADPDPITVGQRGTVAGIHPHGDWTQVDVDWDSGRSLMLTMPDDCVSVVEPIHLEPSK